MANEEEPGSVTKPPKPTNAPTAPKGEDAWWKRVKTPRISLHDFPVWGVKVSKVRGTDGLTRMDWIEIDPTTGINDLIFDSIRFE